MLNFLIVFFFDNFTHMHSGYNNSPEGNCNYLTLEALTLEGKGERVKLTLLDFFCFKFWLLDRLSKALAQLFIVCEHIF